MTDLESVELVLRRLIGRYKASKVQGDTKDCIVAMLEDLVAECAQLQAERDLRS